MKSSLRVLNLDILPLLDAYLSRNHLGLPYLYQGRYTPPKQLKSELEQKVINGETTPFLAANRLIALL